MAVDRYVLVGFCASLAVLCQDDISGVTQTTISSLQRSFSFSLSPDETGRSLRNALLSVRSLPDVLTLLDRRALGIMTASSVVEDVKAITDSDDLSRAAVQGDVSVGLDLPVASRRLTVSNCAGRSERNLTCIGFAA